MGAKTTLTKVLALVADFRKTDAATPLILMGYYNPIYVYGVARFLDDAKAAGVDGLIVVDLPPEEDSELCLPALDAGLDFIRLATPTTDDARLPAVLAHTAGFVYYVSITGITGAATPDYGKVGAAVARLKRIRTCRSRSVSVSRTPRVPPPSPRSPTAWSLARRLLMHCANLSMKRAARLRPASPRSPISSVTWPPASARPPASPSEVRLRIAPTRTLMLRSKDQFRACPKLAC